jgi:glutathione synthase/RimK-type ligase-like ATP-grasp enzyme
MKMVIISGKVGFESSSALAECLKWKYENPYETKNKDFTKYDVVFKYGVSNGVQTKTGAKVLNKRLPTQIAVNKIKTFETFKDQPFTIPFSTEVKTAAKWLKNGSVVARTLLKAHNGEGVVFCDDAEALLNVDEAKVYTKYIDHTHEFRVNVWRDKIVSVYDKVEKNGFFNLKLFKGTEEHPQLKEIVNCIYERTKLDWYGLDLLRDEVGNLYLLEINSAPVLYPYTMKKLVEILKKEYQ